MFADAARASSSPASAPGAAPRLRPDGVGRQVAAFAPAATPAGARRRLRALHAPRPGRAAAAEGRRAPAWCWCVDSRRRSGARPRRRAARRRPQHDLPSAHAAPGRIVTPLKAFPLGLNAERTLDRRPHGAHRQRRADPASGRRPGPQPRPARRVRAGARAGAQRATSTRCCAGSNGSARPTAGR